MNRPQYFEIGFQGIKGNTCPHGGTVLLPKNGHFKSLSTCDAKQNIVNSRIFVQHQKHNFRLLQNLTYLQEDENY